jgi:hypothetical protein
MRSTNFKLYLRDKDDRLRLEYPNGYGNHKKKVVLTIYNGEPVAEVYLDDNEFTLIDVADLSFLESNPFIGHKRHDGQLCARANGENRSYLHRLILMPNEKYQVDHINHNPLDNRLVNLRVCSAKQNHIAKKNLLNKRLNSGYIGVYHLNQSQLDEAPVYVVLHPTEGFIGKKFDCKIEAAKARDERYEDYFSGQYNGGEFFTLNFIEWNFEPKQGSVAFSEAINYDGLRDYNNQEQLVASKEWLYQNEWEFYEAYIEFFNKNE